MRLILSELQSPLCTMLLVTDTQETVRALEFAERRARLDRNLRERYRSVSLADGVAPHAVADALARYFDGDLRAFERIDVAAAGNEPQKKAWSMLRQIPAGQTTTYGALGRSLGITDWRAAVEAGAAVGANPVALIVPCHRVVGVDGDLKGYAWGLHRKRWLLEHEGAIKPEIRAPQTASLPGF